VVSSFTHCVTYGACFWHSFLGHRGLRHSPTATFAINNRTTTGRTGEITEKARARALIFCFTRKQTSPRQELRVIFLHFQKPTFSCKQNRFSSSWIAF
jgi:hypothetical protein